jgi:branched-chain amino acid transport system permease protein
MIPPLLNGLAFGMLLLVLASGLALIFGLRNVVNFAHGALYMLGAYIGLTVAGWTSFWVAIVVAPVALAVIGVLLDRFGLRRLSRRHATDMVLLTYGLTFVITGIVQAIWGTAPRSLSAPAGLTGSTSILGTEYPSYRLFVIAVGLVVGVGLILWLRTSRTGLYIRASTTDRAVAGVVGIDVDRVSGIVVGLGAALAGLAGVLAAPYLTVSPTMGAEVLVLSFVVVIVGGLGSISGAMVAALVLGLLNSFSAVYLPAVSAYVPYLLMAGVLLLRPQGFAGTRTA